MSKATRRERQRQKERERARIVERADGRERALPEPPPLEEGNSPNDVLRQVEQIVERAAVESKQPRFTQPGAFFASVYRWVKQLDLIEPDRRQPRAYDKWLRTFALREPFLAGVLNSVVQIDKNRGWALTGGRNQVARYTNILRAVDEGAGWREYASWQAQSYYTTRLGFVSEIGRDGAEGPLRALWSVDPCRCTLTGDPAKPLRYYPTQGGQQDWLPGDFFRAASLQSTDETQYGAGHPAVLRCLELALIMVGVWEHDQEQLGARAPRGLLLLQGITEDAWESAMQAREEKLDELERQYYGGVAVLAGIGDDVKATLMALSQLPADFDLEKFTNLLMYGFALAFGYDPREFWPVSQGALGTGRETDIQHRKASSKGDLDFSLAHQEKIQGLLPPALHFEYEQRDISGQTDDAALQLQKSQVITEITKWVVNQQTVLTAQQVLQLAADAEIIPHEWALVELDVTATDTSEVARLLERPAVRRAIELHPDEPLVKYEFPRNRTRVLVPRGADALKRRTYPTADWQYRPPVLRSIQEVAQEYDSQLTGFVYQAFQGTMDANDLARAHRALIRSLGPAAYEEGLREGGVDEQDDGDQATIDSWVNGQVGYVRDLAQSAVAAGSDPALRSDVLVRVLLWIDALKTLGAQGKLSAQQNAMATWRWGQTDQHCTARDGKQGCQQLNGVRHRASWFTARQLIPRERGSQTLACGGWGCDCGLFDDNGRRLV